MEKNKNNRKPLLLKKLQIVKQDLISSIIKKNLEVNKVSLFTPSDHILSAGLSENIQELMFPFYPKEFLSKYEIIEKIGKGNQAEVFKVKNIETREIMAAKISITKEAELVLLVKKEVSILQQLTHKNIIQLKEYIESSSMGCYIIVLEYFAGITLKEYLSVKENKVEGNDEILSQIYEGLNYLHQKSIIHRDFNITNILIHKTSKQIKIIDFGISKIYIQTEQFIIPAVEGNSTYKVPIREAKCNPFFEDIWSFAMVSLSVILHEKLSSKKFLKILEIFRNKQSNVIYGENAQISKLLDAFLNAVSEVSLGTKLDASSIIRLQKEYQPSNPLRNFLGIFKSL